MASRSLNLMFDTFFKNSYFWLIVGIFFVAVIAFFLRTFLFWTYTVEGQSMEPAYKDGEVLLVLKTSERASFSVDDVVVFHHPVSEEVLLKRITAIEGDHVHLEQYTGTLGVSEYIVLGDNEQLSTDSRSFGVVQGQSIEGRVLFRLWPIL